MAKKPSADDKTLRLIQEVKRQKEAIASAERPNWTTNCSFSFEEGCSNTTNLHVESNVQKLIKIVSFLISHKSAYDSAVELLGVDAPAFSWDGYSVEDWVSDVELRVAKLQIETKKKKLAALESRLNSIISPELRAQLELEAIEAELGV